MKLLLLILLLTGCLQATSLAKGIEEYHLANGMKVILHPMGKENEVFIQMTAKGGYSILPLQDQKAGALAAALARHAFNLASSDMKVSINPLYRKIEGSCWQEDLSKNLKNLKNYFKNPHIKEADLIKVLYHTPPDNLKNNFEIETKLFNTERWNPFIPLTKRDIQMTSLAAANDFYTKSFSSPAEFVCIITGDFNAAEIKQEIEETLGLLPEKAHHHFSAAPLFPSFPPHISEHHVQHKERKDALCRLTFPLKMSSSEHALSNLNHSSHLIGVICRDALNGQVKKSHGFDVSFEFPFFPYTESPWLLIQFHSNSKDIPDLTKLIVHTLREASENGVSDKALERMVRHVERASIPWDKDPASELAELSNLILLGWDSNTVQKLHAPRKMSKEEAAKMLQETIDLSNYTKIIAAP